MNNVFVFLAPIGNIGLTTTVLSLADELSKNTDSKVAVLNLNAWDDGTDYLQEPLFTLDQIKSRLTGRMFNSVDDFTSKFTHVNENLLVLAGNRDRRSERLYSVEEVQYLVRKASEVFDVVLVDVGSHLDNALSAATLDLADEILIISNQQDKAAKQFEQLYESILMEYPITKKDLKLIMNNYQSRTYLPEAERIAKEMDIELLATLPFVENALLCEIEQKWTILTDDKNFHKALLNVQKYIIEKAQLVEKEQSFKRKKVFGLF